MFQALGGHVSLAGSRRVLSPRACTSQVFASLYILCEDGSLSLRHPKTPRVSAGAWLSGFNGTPAQEALEK